MKSRTYFGLALLFPYVLWILCALIVFVISPLEISTFWNAVFAPAFFYALGILFWFIPYTILAIGLWIWSRGKSKAAIYRAGLVAPLLLIILMLAEVVLISLPVNSFAELTEGLVSQLVVVGGLGLVFGYLCVGIVLLVFKSLQARKFIEEEMPPAQAGG